MNEPKFIQNFEEQFEEVKEGSFSLSTNFKNIEEWSSMHALLIIAMIDAEYEVTISAEDMKNSQTLQDIWTIIQNKE